MSDQPGQTHDFRGGVVTLVFTDVVGSTALKQQLGDKAGLELLQRHHELLRQALAQFVAAREINTAGDSFFLIFPTPSDAVSFALLLQSRLQEFNSRSPKPVRDRIGIHLGEVTLEGGEHPIDLHGLSVDLCARVMSLAGAGQILMTRPVFDNARQSLKGAELEAAGALTWLNHGRFELKGIDEPIDVCEVRSSAAAHLVAPTTSEKARRVEVEGEAVLGWRPAVGQVVPNTRWVLEEKLGEGGFGEVWKARHEKLNQDRVFKFCFRADRVRSLKREVTLFRLLKEHIGEHPNIVKLYDIYFDEPPYYLEEEYVAGKDLRSWCEAQAGIDKLPLELRLELVAQTAEALQAAHDAGVIHRDVKPGNILVSVSPGGTRQTAKLTDFGIGQVISEDLLRDVTHAGFTQTLLSSSSSQTGTQLYMAPELLVGSPASIRSDIYSLGVVLYQMLVGDFTRPVTGDWTDDVPDALFREDLKRCLARRPEDRFVGAGQLANNLRSYAQRKAELERKKSEQVERERLLEQARRRHNLLLAGSAVALVLMALAVALGYGMRKAQAEREQLRRLAYASDMSLAQQAVKLNNIGRARRLLDRHRPGPGREDLRAWEWRYLWQLTRSSALATLTNRPTRGFTLSFSPDGRHLAVGWFDGRGDLWDVRERRFVRTLTQQSPALRGHVAFSPVSNVVLALSARKSVSLYDLDSGRETEFWRVPDDRPLVHDLSFSPDGSRVVICAKNASTGTVWVVKASSGKEESCIPTVVYPSAFHGVARLSPDNLRLYLSELDRGNERYAVRCIDLPTGKKVWQSEPLGDLGLTTLAVSPDGRFLASGSGYQDAFIRIWEAATGRLLVRLDEHNGWICKLVFSRDGARLFSAATDQTIRVWDTSTWTETTVLRGHSDEIHGLAVSEAAQLIASAGKDGNLMLWDLSRNSATDGYSRLPENLRLDGLELLDEARVLLAPPGQPPRVVDYKRTPPSETALELGGSTNVLRWFGTNLCSWAGAGQLLFAQLQGSTCIVRRTLAVNSSTPPTLLAFNPANQMWAWSAGTGSVSLAELAVTNRQRELKTDLGRANLIAFSPKGDFLAGVLADGESEYVRIWRVATGEMMKAGRGIVRPDPVFAAGGRMFVVAIDSGIDHEVLFYDLVHPGLEPRRQHGRHFVMALAVSCDGGVVAAATEGGIVTLFNGANGERLAELHGHLNAAATVAFSADGKRLITASGGREVVKLWDLQTRQELLNFAGSGALLTRAGWSADGNAIFAGRPWQAWRAPSWAEIEAAEKLERNR